MSSQTDLYGKGATYPMRSSVSGDLELEEGEELIWQAIEHVLDTPQGSYPLDPLFGIPPLVFEPSASPYTTAYQIALAIERAEPRIARLRVTPIAASADDGTLSIRVGWAPIGERVLRNKIFPLYRL